MSAQLPLLDGTPLRALARATDPDTSHIAAGRICVKRLAERIRVCLLMTGPATSHELAERLKVDLVSISPRMKPLEEAKLVERAGKRDNRTVWRAT